MNGSLNRLVLTIATILSASFFTAAASARPLLLTFYCPAVNDKFEGGPLTMLGSKVVTLEESGRTGSLPTLASWTSFAGKCNNNYKTTRSAQRCVVSIKVPGVSRLPGYKAHVAKFKNRYPQLCETCETILGVVEDTGNIYNRQNKSNPQRMFDLATDSRNLCRRGVNFRTDNLKWNLVGYVPGSGRPRYKK